MADALTKQREKRETKYNEHMVRWQYAQKVLQGLAACLADTQLPRWSFTPNGEEIVVLYQQSSTGSKDRVGVWYVDDQYRLTFGEETTEWITQESWRRVIEEAVVITANVILDRETQLLTHEPARITHEANGQRQPDLAS